MKMRFLQERTFLSVVIFTTLIFSVLSVMVPSHFFFKMLLAVFIAISVALVTGKTMAKFGMKLSMEEIDDGQNRKYLEMRKNSNDKMKISMEEVHDGQNRKYLEVRKKFEGKMKLSVEALLTRDLNDCLDMDFFSAQKNSEATFKLSMETLLTTDHDEGQNRQVFSAQKRTECDDRSFTMNVLFRELHNDQNKQELLLQKNAEGNRLSLAMRSLLRDLDNGDGQKKIGEGKMNLAMEALLISELDDDPKIQDFSLQNDTDGKMKLGSVEALLKKLDDDCKERQEHPEGNNNRIFANVTVCKHCKRVASVPEEEEKQAGRRSYGGDCSSFSHKKAISASKLKNTSRSISFEEESNKTICNMTAMDCLRCHDFEASVDHGEDEESVVKHQILPVERYDSGHNTATCGGNDVVYDRESSTSSISTRGRNDAFSDRVSSTFTTNSSEGLNVAKYGVNDAISDRISSTFAFNSSRGLNDAEYGVNDSISHKIRSTFATTSSRGLNDPKYGINGAINSRRGSNDANCAGNDGLSYRTGSTFSSNSSGALNDAATSGGISATFAANSRREPEEITDAELQNAASEFYTLEGDVLWTECDLIKSKKITDQYPCKLRFDPHKIAEKPEIVHNADAIQCQIKQEAIPKVAMDNGSIKTFHDVEAMNDESIKMVHNVDAKDGESIKMIHGVDSIQSQNKQTGKLQVAMDDIQEVREEMDEKMVIDQRLRAIAFRSENINIGDESNYMSIPGSFRELETIWSPHAEDGCSDIDIYKREESNYMIMLNGCCDDHGRPCMAHSRSRSKVLQTDPLLSKASLSLREQEIMDILWQEQYNEHRSLCCKKGSKTWIECDNTVDEDIDPNGYSCNNNRSITKNTCMLGCKNKACWHNVDKDQRGYQRRRYFLGVCRALREMGLKQCLQSSKVNN